MANGKDSTPSGALQQKTYCFTINFYRFTTNMGAPMQHTPASPSLHLARHARVVQALALAGAALLVVQPLLLLLARRCRLLGSCRHCAPPAMA
jgi:hypothetical protein